MGDRKGKKSGAISPFIPEFRLCLDSGFKPGSNERVAGIAGYLVAVLGDVISLFSNRCCVLHVKCVL